MTLRRSRRYLHSFIILSVAAAHAFVPAEVLVLLLVAVALALIRHAAAASTADAAAHRTEDA